MSVPSPETESRVASPDGTQARLPSLLRAVNRRIARQARLPVIAVACECSSRTCEDAVEVPLAVFQVAEARPGFYVVRPGHESPPVDRVVRRDAAYVVVDRPR